MEQVVVKATNSIHKVEIIKSVEGNTSSYIVKNVKKKSSGRGRSGVATHTSPTEAYKDFRAKVAQRASADKENLKALWPNGKKTFAEFNHD